jgi:hypothetical protein
MKFFLKQKEQKGLTGWLRVRLLDLVIEAVSIGHWMAWRLKPACGPNNSNMEQTYQRW